MLKDKFKALNKIGKGWFVLKLAEDSGISINTSLDYGKESSFKTRTNYFNKTKEYHKEFLEEILKNTCSRISAGLPRLSSNEIYEIAKKLVK